MADVDRLLREFIEQDRAGGPADPLEFLERVQGTDRVELEALIDGYLARAPRRPFDRDAFAGTPAEAVADELGRAFGGVSGTWPALLPRLRHQAQLRRAEVIARLADALGAGGAQRDKVARYYHGMERGTLPATGVSDRVLDALATIVGVSAERLREAGREGAGAAPGPAATVAFARVGEPDPQYADEGWPAGAGAGEQEAHDEIDDLFTGPSAS